MSAGPGGNTASPVDCSVCNHSGRYTQCPGCGGLIGMGAWPPCTYCRAAIGVAEPPPVPPMVSTIHSVIDATEPHILPPLEAFAADAELRSAREYVDLVADVAELRGEVRQLLDKVDMLVGVVLRRNA